ncbi:hypothetical protein [Streptomyces sp. NPDC006285]|uniref:hypothetical protein n=1 Tax=Streptomyces sp. NPDC006285 TaxID=3364742 RepID=UPI003690DDA2
MDTGQPIATQRRGTMAGEEMASRTDLADLVRNRKEELGLSFRALADACVDPEDPEAGPLWKRSTLENLAAGRVIKAPDFAQLRALAAGFTLPLGLVQEAAGGQFMGIDTVWSEDGKVRALVHEFHDMDDEDQEKVLALMQSWRKLKRD